MTKGEYGREDASVSSSSEKARGICAWAIVVVGSILLLLDVDVYDVGDKDQGTLVVVDIDDVDVEGGSGCGLLQDDDQYDDNEEEGKEETLWSGGCNS